MIKPEQPKKLQSLDEVWNEIIIFNDKYFPDWREWDWRLTSNALAGEVGEVCDATKHAYGGGTNETAGKVKRRDIAKECFDVLVYSALLIGEMGYSKRDFIHICQEKLSVLYQRMEMRQPDGISMKGEQSLRHKFSNETAGEHSYGPVCELCGGGLCELHDEERPRGY